MTVTANQLLEEARLSVGELSPEEAKSGLDNHQLDVLLDVREPGEWEAGHVPEAIHVPRGLLEWKADPTSPAHDPRLAGARIAVICASGGRSLLAAKTLRDMGYEQVFSVAGGMKAWGSAEQVG